MTKSRIKKNMEVIGADGVHIGTVDRITAGSIRLTKNDSGEGRHKGHHHILTWDWSLISRARRCGCRRSRLPLLPFEEEKSGGQPSKQT